MAGTAGHNTQVSKSGTPTAFTAEGMTNTVSNAWVINSKSKSLWDRSVKPTFYDNGVEILDNEILEVDYLFGVVKLDGTHNGPITVAGTYLPLSVIAGAKQINLNRTAGIQDSTDFDNSGFRTKAYTMMDATFSVTRFDDITGAFQTALNARSPVVVEAVLGDSLAYRAWCVIESVNNTLDLSSLLEESMSFQLAGGYIPGTTFSSKYL